MVLLVLVLHTLGMRMRKCPKFIPFNAVKGFRAKGQRDNQKIFPPFFIYESVVFSEWFGFSENL